MRDSDIAYNQIMKMLLNGSVKCGEVVDDTKLMVQLGIGKTPLREALNRLAQEGYVNVMPRKGMIYVNVTLADLEGIFNLRYEMSGYLGRLVTQRITDEDIEQLEEFLRRSPIPKQGDYYEGIGTDLEFHKLFNSFSRDEYVCSLFEKLHNLSAIALFPRSKDIPFSQNSAVETEFKELIECLKKRDEENVIRLLKEHIPKYMISW